MSDVIRSMTGFGEASNEDARRRVTVTMRSVNHRGLDVVFRLPDELRNREADFRRIVGIGITRGRVDIRVGLEWIGERVWKVEVREGLLRELQRAFASLDQTSIDTSAKLTFGDLARVPDVIHVEADNNEWTTDDSRLVDNVLEEALAATLESRLVEGAELRSIFTRDLKRLTAIAEKLEEQRAVVSRDLMESLRERVKALLDESDVPDDRIAQEAAILVEKSDVLEELDRLQAHLSQFLTILRKGGSVGRRLNFLCQEILRELNTLGSKCRDSQMTNGVLDGKVICEEIREQVQNVE